MRKGFVDTTIMVDYLLKKGEEHYVAKKALASFDHTALPAYTIKEFALGALTYYVWTHNKLALTKSLADTLRAINGMSRSLKKNWAASARQALYEAARKYQFSRTTLQQLVNRYGGSAEPDFVHADQCRLELRKIIKEAWKKRRSFTTEIVEELECFSEEPLAEPNEILKIMSECKSACAVAKKLSSQPVELRKLISVLKTSEKPEDQRRYKALHDLARKPAVPVSSTQCRNFGDAVFVLLAPNDSEILTTNRKDFEIARQGSGEISCRSVTLWPTHHYASYLDCCEIGTGNWVVWIQEISNAFDAGLFYSIPLRRLQRAADRLHSVYEFHDHEGPYPSLV